MFLTSLPSRQLHPIVSGLLKSRKRDRPALALFDRSTPSNAWITEALLESTPTPEPRAEAEDSDADDDDEVEPYDVSLPLGF